MKIKKEYRLAHDKGWGDTDEGEQAKDVPTQLNHESRID
jgi:hypothetical protein